MGWRNFPSLTSGKNSTRRIELFAVDLAGLPWRPLAGLADRAVIGRAVHPATCRAVVAPMEAEKLIGSRIGALQSLLGNLAAPRSQDDSFAALAARRLILIPLPAQICNVSSHRAASLRAGAVFR